MSSHNWLKENLFQQRVDSRKKTEYKAKFREFHRQDWKRIQTEWMKYCLNLKYRDNAAFRTDYQITTKRMMNTVIAKTKNAKAE